MMAMQMTVAVAAVVMMTVVVPMPMVMLVPRTAVVCVGMRVHRGILLRTCRSSPTQKCQPLHSQPLINNNAHNNAHELCAETRFDFIPASHLTSKGLLGNGK